MQFNCHRCQFLLSVPDQARQHGGTFICPRCTTPNMLAAAAVPVAFAATSKPAKPTDYRKWILIVLGVVLFTVADGTPAAGIVLGIALIGWSIASVTRGFRSLPALIYPAVKGSMPAAIGTLGFGVLLIAVAINSLVERATQREAAERAEKNAQEHRDREAAEKLVEEQRIAAEAAARDVRLRADAGSVSAAFNKSLDDIQTSIAASEWQSAQKQLEAIAPQADSFKALSPTPAEYHGVLARYAKMQAQVSPLAPLAAKLANARELSARANQLTSGTKDGETWSQAKSLWLEALQEVEGVESSDPSVRSRVSDELPALRRSIEASLKKASRYADPYERKLAELAALKVVCGDAPVGCGGGWDGECIGAKSAFKQIAHDPGSVDVENCSAPVLSKKHCWVSECTVRAKNAFGAKIAKTHTFSFSTLGVEVIE